MNRTPDLVGVITPPYTLDIKTLEPVTAAVTVASTYPDAVHKRLSDDRSLSINLAADHGGALDDGVRYLLK
ncbi:MAG TPA: hypothetical protein VE890_14390 [Thermoguttaceae bacterium]|nr:hypothetical protein [Thermoguttaceae bacterium]